MSSIWMCLSCQREYSNLREELIEIDSERLALEVAKMKGTFVVSTFSNEMKLQF